MRIQTFTVKPQIPEALEPLEELARNLWISWNFDAIMLFIRLDYDTWMQSHQSPSRMLGMVSQERYELMAQDDSYLAALNVVFEKFKAYKEGLTWFTGSRKNAIAYFSMEYGIDVSLPIYSGGLGILSGDHLKAASDLGLPLVAVGLLFRQGYFRQYLNADGYQQESYPENDWYSMPVRQCRAASGEPLRFELELGDKTAVVQVWEAEVGRVSLYLLDTNIPENEQALRDITATLYGGNLETRIQQEILLGVGGIRALRALGVNPAVTHMNEAYSAFLSLERVREYMKTYGFTFSQAAQALWPTNVFTTHAALPEGNERFPVELVSKYFKAWAAELGIEWVKIAAMGRENPQDESELFCMTVLALKTSAYCNGVSSLHGNVSRSMWKGLWKDLPEREIPIASITNGVHPRTWISNAMLELLDRYVGPRLEEEPNNWDIWDRINRISDEELWRTHDRRRERLVVFARDRLRQQLRRNGAGEVSLQRAEDVLSPYVLTIAFARRFAECKRGELLLRDPERLARLLADKNHPLQIIFAGKAHPADAAGKELIKRIVHFAQRPEFRSRIVFLEDYDMTMARYLTSGADVWLNTPRRTQEASGTSGIKAGLNGVLNCSVLDGWWDEAYNPETGWAIGKGEVYDNHELQDEIESKSLFDLLEREIIPQFYSRGQDGLPREWIKKMKASIRQMGKDYSSHRMVTQYAERFYFPALSAYDHFSRNGFKDAVELSAYVDRVRQAWPDISVKCISNDAKPIMERGKKVKASATVDLCGLNPVDVRVELYHGSVTTQGAFTSPERVEMRATEKEGTDWQYSAEVICSHTGRQGFSVRVLPHHRALVHPFLPGLITWAC
jgi:starch phosphorylase